MTGEKDRYKTHEQLWKLEDGELSTPQHDELVLQLLNYKNAEKITEYIGLTPTFKQEFKPGYGYLGSYNTIKPSDENMKFLKEKAMNDFENSEYKKLEILSEVPIKTDKSFLIGYIDIQIKIPLFVKYIIEFDPINENGFIFNLVPKGCATITDREGEGIGAFIFKDGLFDEIIQPLYSLNIPYWTLNIEVKPKIKSFGETLRQINTYRTYTKNDTYIIYSPDARFKEAFRTQGIDLITPSDLGIK